MKHLFTFLSALMLTLLCGQVAMDCFGTVTIGSISNKLIIKH